MTEQTIRTDAPAEGVARITLARPEMRNAQNLAMLYALNDAFDAAAHDPGVKVIVLAADGPHFSSGHDLAADRTMPDAPTVTPWGGFDAPGVDHHVIASLGLIPRGQPFIFQCCFWKVRVI